MLMLREYWLTVNTCVNVICFSEKFISKKQPWKSLELIEMSASKSELCNIDLHLLRTLYDLLLFTLIQNLPEWHMKYFAMFSL